MDQGLYDACSLSLIPEILIIVGGGHLQYMSSFGSCLVHEKFANS